MRQWIVTELWRTGFRVVGIWGGGHGFAWVGSKFCISVLGRWGRCLSRFFESFEMAGHLFGVPQRAYDFRVCLYDNNSVEILLCLGVTESLYIFKGENLWEPNGWDEQNVVGLGTAITKYHTYIGVASFTFSNFKTPLLKFLSIKALGEHSNFEFIFWHSIIFWYVCVILGTNHLYSLFHD